jgi:type IV pilus assembly protein PilN
VILINLLPHREEKRRQRKRAFFTGLGVAAACGALVVAGWYFVLDALKGAQLSRNNFLSSEIARLDAQVRDIATLRAEIEGLKARQKSVEDLQTDRNTPVYLLNEIASQTPEGVYLSAIRQAGQVVTVNGVAQTNERVSEILRNLGNSTWLERPELIEIKAANVTTAGRETRRLYDFSLRVTLKRPQAPAAPGAPAAPPGAPAPPAKSS